MRAAALLVALTAFLLVGCDDGAPDLAGLTPEQVRADAVSAMQGLESYSALLDFGESAWNVDFATPERYRIADKYLAPGALDPRLHETVALNNSAYHRTCESPGNDCDPWTVTPYSALPLLGFYSLHLPQWPLVTLELATELEFVPDDEFIHMRGLANDYRARHENINRVLEASGVEPGNLCMDSSLIEERCKAYGQTQEVEASAMTYYDEHPTTIEAWLDPKTFRVRLIELTTAESTLFRFEYSDFNEVTVEAPVP